jgi:hypothetical protein
VPALKKAHRRVDVLLVPALCLLAWASGLRAQRVGDPNDVVAADLEVFEARRLIGPLPPLQPLPLPLVKSLLRRVIEHDDATDAEIGRARFLLASISDPLPHLAIDGEVRTDAWSTSGGPYALAALDPDWQLEVTDWLSLHSQVRVSVVRLDDGLRLPAAVGNPEDFIVDNTTIDAGSQRLQLRQISYGGLAAGVVDDEGALFFQANLSRHRVGPFYRNGIIMGPQAPVAGEFSALFQRPLFSAQIALLPLQATNDVGEGRASGKYSFYHGLELHPTAWFDVGVFETVITGRLELLYLLPASAYFHAQGLGGFADNSLVGLTGRVRPLPGLEFKGVFFADDFEFNDTIRGVLDTKYKFATQLGASWTPVSTWRELPFVETLRLVTLDYTAIMPYVFSHLNQGEPGSFNGGNYTNGGQPMGAALDPNSDRLEARALWRVAQEQAVVVDIETRGAMIRHGNASAGIIDGADGSIFDPGYIGTTPTFQPPFEDPTGQPFTRFLTQDVIETTWQAGLSARVTLQTGSADGEQLRRGWGSPSAGLDLTWQWQENAGLEAGARRGALFLGGTLAWRY